MKKRVSLETAIMLVDNGIFIKSDRIYLNEANSIECLLGNTFQVQDSTAEITVGKEKDKWGLGGVFRERVENAGDILRELSSRGNKPDYRYIDEKVNKIEKWLANDYLEIPNNIKTLEQFNNSNLRWTNSMDGRDFVVKFYPNILNQTIEEYDNIPVYSEETKIAKDLVLALLHGDWINLKNSLDKIKDISNRIKKNGLLFYSDID